MALDLCLETYGSLAPFVDSHIFASFPRLRTRLGVRSPSRAGNAAAGWAASKSTPYTDTGRAGSDVGRDAPFADTAGRVSMASRVSAIADRLPFLLAQALWLVDVCGCSYAEAAAELTTTPEVIGQRVADGRAAIRAELAHRPLVGPPPPPTGIG